MSSFEEQQAATAPFDVAKPASALVVVHPILIPDLQPRASSAVKRCLAAKVCARFPKLISSTVCTHTTGIAHLSPAFAAPELSTISEAPVEVDSDETLIQRHAIDVLHAVFCVGACVVHHKAEAARRVPNLVEAHDYPLDVACLREHLLAGRSRRDSICFRERRSMRLEHAVQRAAVVRSTARKESAHTSGCNSPRGGVVPE